MTILLLTKLHNNILNCISTQVYILPGCVRVVRALRDSVVLVLEADPAEPSTSPSHSAVPPPLPKKPNKRKPEEKIMAQNQ